MSAPTTSQPDTASSAQPGDETAETSGRQRSARSAAATLRRGASGLREQLTDFRRRTRDWLDRPMTSFHLLLAVFFLLLGYGLLMVLSSSSVTAYRKDGSSFGTFKKQLLFAGIGLIAFYVAMRVRLQWLRSMSTVLMIGCLGLLVIVLPMPKINGAHSWIKFGAVSFQPSELAKFALVIWGAHVLASRRANLGSLKELLIPVLPVAGLMAGLIVIEPDLGTTAALLVIVCALFFFAGASWKMFGLLTGLGVGGLAVLAVVEPYRLKRVVSFLHPEDDAQGAGMQLLQGLYGMADGGWFGVGLGQSRAKWAYLPHAESDFIFAIVGEELGFIGAGLLVGLYVTLALVGLRIARRNVDPFVKLVAATSTAWLVGQAAINIFYVVGLLPVTGLTLPMVSAGGTSLLVTMTIFGLLANFARREPAAMAALQQSGPGPMSRFFGIGVPGAGFEDGPLGRARARNRAQRREERKQNHEWARTSQRKVADERRTQRAAARQRPVDRRDEQPRSRTVPSARTAPGLRQPSPFEESTEIPGARRDSPSTARLTRPVVPAPRSSLRAWFGFGAAPVGQSGRAKSVRPSARPRSRGTEESSRGSDKPGRWDDRGARDERSRGDERGRGDERRRGDERGGDQPGRRQGRGARSNPAAPLPRTTPPRSTPARDPQQRPR